MKVRLPEKIDRGEWAKLLGMNEEDLEEESLLRCEEMLFESASPQGYFVYSDDMDFEGNAIRKHLEGCSRVAIMGVTLGRGADDLISKLQVRDMKEAVYADTGASALVEMVADLFEEDIREKLPEETPYMTFRYSPGYGDLPLETQKKLIRELDAERKMGLTVNEDNLMVPLKSVTAVMGMSDRPVTGHLAECKECLLYEDCEKRKKGNICGKE